MPGLLAKSIVRLRRGLGHAFPRDLAATCESPGSLSFTPRLCYQVQPDLLADHRFARPRATRERQPRPMSENRAILFRTKICNIFAT